MSNSGPGRMMLSMVVDLSWAASSSEVKTKYHHYKALPLGKFRKGRRERDIMT